MKLYIEELNVLVGGKQAQVGGFWLSLYVFFNARMIACCLLVDIYSRLFVLYMGYFPDVYIERRGSDDNAEVISRKIT